MLEASTRSGVHLYLDLSPTAGSVNTHIPLCRYGEMTWIELLILFEQLCHILEKVKLGGDQDFD